jgi:hypothetical protein
MNQLAEVLAGQLTGWAGLPPGTPVAEVLAALQPVAVDDAGPTERGSSRYDLQHVRRAGPPELVDVWSLTGETVLVEFADPPGIDLGLQPGALGGPELVLTGQRLAAGGQVHELVYASRGLTLSLVRAGDGWLRAAHLQLYVPGPVSRWLTRIGAGPRLHPSTRPAPPQPAGPDVP